MKPLHIMVVGAAALSLSGCSLVDNLANKVEETTGMSVPTSKEEAFSGSLKAAVELGVPMKCTYTLEDGTEAEGYIKGKQYRGKSTTDEGVVANVLIKNECMYSWEESAAEGVKMCFNEMGAEETNEAEDDTASIWNMDEVPTDMDVNCRPAVVGEEQFTPPSSVEFADFGQMMQDAFMGLGEEMQNSMEEGMEMSDEELQQMEQEAQEMLRQMEENLPEAYQ